MSRTPFDTAREVSGCSSHRLRFAIGRTGGGSGAMLSWTKRFRRVWADKKRYLEGSNLKEVERGLVNHRRSIVSRSCKDVVSFLLPVSVNDQSS